MFGTYEESAKIIEKLMKLYQEIPMEEPEKLSALNALMAARALILKEEEDAIRRCEHYFEGRVYPQSEWDDLPFDIRHIDTSLKNQQNSGGH